ncbi:putative sugar nucleotidyl transferase [Chitinophaga sp. sic0106]|uniref:putative sugar nucleotidyl transferase n=1 Tax=Chitinophaga sp. sic0106 TaxID=2854785 RepID=UPI001C44EDF1|nr:putative sugar nucleotidyl transferase [Chitinophaga sp. sic0106]MBV7529369.1 glucose-1-phosphate thymidylyltransferase [Chitinophaga sp. sic0106]
MERNYILFDTPVRDLLFPFTHTRPISACRVGILTIQEKWEKWLGAGVSHFTVQHLQEKFPLHQGTADTLNILISGHLLPDEQLVAAIMALQPEEELYHDNHLIAKVVRGMEVHLLPANARKNYTGKVLGIHKPWDIFALNDAAIREDFRLLTKGRVSEPVPAGNQVLGAEQVFIEPGASVQCSVLNASSGPVYIGRDAVVMEGSLVRGPFAMGERAVLKMGSKVYGATTLGPYCIGGGEIKNVVMFGYSNKSHEGYLGDAVIGEWCNLGGGTNCSNMKNNASAVRVWMESKNETESAGLKCGVLMGDYSRTGIGTNLNTGTVVGVSCNIFGGQMPPKYLPSFSWAQGDTVSRYRGEEALKDAAAWMKLKGQELTPADAAILRGLHQRTDRTEL